MDIQHPHNHNRKLIQRKTSDFLKKVCVAILALLWKITEAKIGKSVLVTVKLILRYYIAYFIVVRVNCCCQNDAQEFFPDYREGDFLSLQGKILDRK